MEIMLQGHIIICNYPGLEKVEQLITELRANPNFAKTPIVLVTEMLDELPEPLVKLKIRFVKGFPTDEVILNKAKILDSAGVIILAEDPNNMRSDDRSFTVGSIIEQMEKEYNHPIKTVVELTSARNMGTMLRTQVDGIVSSENLATNLLAQEFGAPGVSEIISQLLTHQQGCEIYICESRLQGYPIVELQKAVLTHEANIQVIGIIQDGNKILNPSKQLKIKDGDQLIILADKAHDLSRIESDILAKA